MLLPGALAMAAPLAAQVAEAPDSPAQMVDNARYYYGVARPLSGCDAPTMQDEIVVCGHRAPDPRYQALQAPTREDAKTVALGAPPMGKGVGASATMRGCFLQRCPKDLYFIDLSALPEPAPGTDADKMAHGEMRAR